MTKLEQYQAKHAEVVAAQRKILEAAAAANELGELSKEQDAEYKALDEKRLKLAAAIRREKEIEAADLAAQPVTSTALVPVDGDDPHATPQKYARFTALEDRAINKPWRSLGEQMLAIKDAFSPGQVVDPRLFAGTPSGMNQMVPSEGGFAVAPQFSTEIWDRLNASTDSLIGDTDRYTIEGESLTFNANAETSRSTGSRYGGVQGYWINEADQVTKSKPKLRQIKLEPTELAVLIYCTAKALENAPALEQFLTRAATDELGFLIGDSIVNGLGGFQPKGLMASGSKVIVNKETSQPTGTFLKANANKMWARLHPRLQADAIWLMNIDVSPALDDFYTAVKNVAGSENVGGFGTLIYNAERNTLKGRPIRFVEYCQSFSTEGDIILTNLGTYATAVRASGLKYASSIHVRFEYAETAFRFMTAVDGQSWMNSPLTPFKGSNTLTNVVTLQTR